MKLPVVRFIADGAGHSQRELADRVGWNPEFYRALAGKKAANGLFIITSNFRAEVRLSGLHDAHMEARLRHGAGDIA
jgi:hypothetical protein